MEYLITESLCCGLFAPQIQVLGLACFLEKEDEIPLLGEEVFLTCEMDFFFHWKGKCRRRRLLVDRFPRFPRASRDQSYQVPWVLGKAEITERV